jgi:membrane associated rhomboid family serine protease
VLVALNVLIFFGSTSAKARTFSDFALFGPSVDPGGEYYRLITSGFLHDGFLHIGFNMYILWWLGNMLEPSMGTPRYTALYLTGLLGGSFGALLLDPTALTVGASGAVFALLGAAFVMQRAQGVDPMQSGIGPVILLNLVISFLPGLNISIGGHLGGLAAGGLAAWAMQQLAARRAGVAPQIGVCLLIAAIAVGGALAVAGRGA